MTTIRVKANSIGKVLAGSIYDTEIRCDWTKTALGILVNNGLDNKLVGVRGSGGYLLQVRNCKSLMWSSGGSDSPTHQYGAYIGDVLAGDFARRVEFIATRFTHAVNQAIVRVMGGDVTFSEGRYDQSGNSGNEAWQLRHGRFLAIGSTVIGSIVIGPLEPGQAGASAIDKYHAFNHAAPNYAHLPDCNLTGHFRAVGRSEIVVDGGATHGKDPRGGSPSRVFNTTTFRSKYGVHEPHVIVTNHRAFGFKEFAAPSVVIGPGCWLNDTKVPTRNWTAKNQALAQKIRAEAAKR